MNISTATIEILKREIGTPVFYDENFNVSSPDRATEISFQFGVDGDYIGKRIKAGKKEVTFSSIFEKMNAEKTFVNFSDKFAKLINCPNLNVYPTTYGIGVFVLFGNMSEIKKDIASKLNSLGIEYTTEYSDASLVFRYKISKSKENIARL